MIILSIPFAAKVNVLMNKWFTQGTILSYVFVLLRIFVGPFQANFVIAYYYYLRIVTLVFFNMLTFKMALMSAFIIDFNKVSGE